MLLSGVRNAVYVKSGSIQYFVTAGVTKSTYKKNSYLNFPSLEYKNNCCVFSVILVISVGYGTLRFKSML